MPDPFAQPRLKQTAGHMSLLQQAFFLQARPFQGGPTPAPSVIGAARGGRYFPACPAEEDTPE